LKPNIFKDTALQAQFDRDGYVVMDFISREEVDRISKKFYALHPNLPKGFYSAAYNPDEKFKEEIFAYTEKIFQPLLDKKFENFKKLGSTFLCKSPGEEGRKGVHQDWTVVDESKFYSCTIWIPLVDTNEENGTIRVIPGSHLFFNHFRSNNIPVTYNNSIDLLWDNMDSVSMKAGQAFVLNHAVIHGSSANTTNKERLVVAYGIASKEANLVFYYKNPSANKDKIEKFEMPDDFFQRYYNAPERPLFGNAVDEFDYAVEATDAATINQLLRNEKIKRGRFIEFDDILVVEKSTPLKFIQKILNKIF
jgi:ectoine hydroxylase-related dioxygenase (phytanoyl-CoA dioxygenase family)